MRTNVNADSIMAIFEYAKMDPKYAQMNGTYGVLEDLFDKCVAKLLKEDQDIIWGFLCLSEEMNWRILELLCERYNIDFTEDRSLIRLC